MKETVEIVILALILCLFGCGPHSRPSQAIVSIGQLSTEVLGDAYKIHSPDVEDYIRTYGLRGWLVGLCDERTVLEAQEKSGNVEVPLRQANARYLDLKVSDVFLWYYIREYPDVNDGLSFGSQSDRNIERQKALKRVRESLLR